MILFLEFHKVDTSMSLSSLRFLSHDSATDALVGALLEPVSSFSFPKGPPVNFLSVVLKAREATVCFLQSAAP